MKTRFAAVTLVALLALTGCAGGSDSAGGESTAPGATESAAPLVAETPVSDVSESEEAFLEAFRDVQTTYPSVIPDATDEQLLAAGYEACDRLAAGEASTDISLIEGEERNPQSEMYLDSVSIVGAAQPRLCP